MICESCQAIIDRYGPHDCPSILLEELRLFDEAVARAQALGRPFEDKEVFGFIWEQGYELVPQMDSRFVLVREATGKTRRLWSVVNEAELP